MRHICGATFLRETFDYLFRKAFVKRYSTIDTMYRTRLSKLLADLYVKITFGQQGYKRLDTPLSGQKAKVVRHMKAAPAFFLFMILRLTMSTLTSLSHFS